MSKIRYAPPVFVILFLIVTVFTSTAQVTIKSLDTPEGEAMVGTAVLHDVVAGNDVEAMLAATPNRLYLFNETKMKEVYSPGGATTISGMYVKHKSKNVLFLVQSDNSIQILTFNAKMLSLDSRRVYPSFSSGIRFLAGDDVYAVTYGGVYVTRDDFVSWQIDTVGISGKFIQSIALDSNQNVYIGTFQGLFRQSAKASVWTPVSSPCSNVSFVFADLQNRLYISGTNQLMVSSDNGSSWSFDTTGLQPFGTASIMTSTSAGQHYLTTTNSNNGTRFYNQQSVLGKWNAIDSSFRESNPDTNDTRLFTGISAGLTINVATKFGIFSSGINTYNFNPVPGIHAENISPYLRFLFEGKVNPSVQMGTSLGLYSRDDTLGIFNYTKFFPVRGYQDVPPVYRDTNGFLYSVHVHSQSSGPKIGNFYQSVNGGSSWYPLDSLKFDSANAPQRNIGVYHIDVYGNIMNALPGSGGGLPIFSVKRPLKPWKPDSLGMDLSKYDVPYQYGNDGKQNVFVTVNNYKSTNRMFERKNSDSAWKQIENGYGGKGIYNMKSGPDKNLLAGSVNGFQVYDGVTWKYLPAPPSIPATPSCYVFGVDSNKTIYAAWGSTDLSSYVYTPHGVFATTDMGGSWTKMGLDDANINQIVCFGDTAYVTTFNGAYSIFWSRVSSAVSSSNTTESLKVYPNPASGICEIEIDESIGEYRVTITDELGRVVDCSELSGVASTRNLHLDTQLLAAGMYHVELVSSTSIRTALLSVVH